MRVFSICVLVYFLACPSVSLRSQNGGNREPGIVAHRGYWNGALWLGDGCMAH